jgi:hypothetical protein
MHPLHAIIHKEIVGPALMKRIHPIQAKILDYDNKNNLAMVEFKSPFGLGMMSIPAVPVVIGSGGVHSAGPFIGDQVWLTFLNGNENMPRITGLVNELKYQEQVREGRMKHERKGSLIPDTLIRR